VGQNSLIINALEEKKNPMIQQLFQIIFKRLIITAVCSVAFGE
jgi:hypothetical protein